MKPFIVSALVLPFSGCGWMSLGGDVLTGYASDYIEERSAQESMILRSGEIITCRRVPVGTARREYAGTAVWEPWNDYCNAVRELREPVRTGVVLP